jgi:hypothetical protein
VAALQLAEERLATHAPGGQEHVAAQKEIADVRQCIHDLRKKVEKIDDLQFADPIQRWQFEVIGDVLLDLRRLCEPAGLLPRMRKTTNSASPL